MKNGTLAQAKNLSVEEYKPGYKLVTAEARQKEAEEQAKALADIDLMAYHGDGRDALYEFADIVYERVQVSETPFNPVNQMFNRVSGRLGVSVKSKRLYGARVYHRTYGEYKRSSTLQAAEYTVSTSPKSVRVDVVSEEIQTGVVTASDIAGAINKAIDRHKVKLAWDTWIDALPAGGAYVDDFTGDITGAEMRTVINEVSDLSDVGAILARGTLLAPLTVEAGYDGSSGFSEQQKNEIHNNGTLGSYYGTVMIGMKSWEDELYNNAAVIAATDILVMPAADRLSEITRFAELGGVRRTVVPDPFTGTISFLVDFEDGAAVWEAKYARRLRQTS